MPSMEIIFFPWMFNWDFVRIYNNLHKSMEINLKSFINKIRIIIFSNYYFCSVQLSAIVSFQVPVILLNLIHFIFINLIISSAKWCKPFLCLCTPSTKVEILITNVNDMKRFELQHENGVTWLIDTAIVYAFKGTCGNFNYFGCSIVFWQSLVWVAVSVFVKMKTNRMLCRDKGNMPAQIKAKLDAFKHSCHCEKMDSWI